MGLLASQTSIVVGQGAVERGTKEGRDNLELLTTPTSSCCVSIILQVSRARCGHTVRALSWLGICSKRRDQRALFQTHIRLISLRPLEGLHQSSNLQIDTDTSLICPLATRRTPHRLLPTITHTFSNRTDRRLSTITATEDLSKDTTSCVDVAVVHTREQDEDQPRVPVVRKTQTRMVSFSSATRLNDD